MNWLSLFVGVLIGWLAEWLIDVFYWRRRRQDAPVKEKVLSERRTPVAPSLVAAAIAWAKSKRGPVEHRPSFEGHTDGAVRAGAEQGEPTGVGQSRVELALQAHEAEAKPPLPATALGPAVAHLSPGADVLPSAARKASAGELPAPVAGEDDLTVLEGIGPKLATLLNDAGIRTFAALAATDPNRIREILRAGGPRFQIADPGSWPEQARLAAAGAWAELRALQDRLSGGVQR